MTSRLTQHAYAKLIAEDIAWLRAQPRTLERDHLILVAQQSIEAEYPGQRLRDLEEIVELICQGIQWIRPSAGYLETQRASIRATAGKALPALDHLHAYLETWADSKIQRAK